MFWGDDMNVEKNMFTIGEMAKSIGITRKIILNYEAKGLITPDSVSYTHLSTLLFQLLPK